MTDVTVDIDMSMQVVVDEDEVDTLVEGAHVILELPDEVIIEDVRVSSRRLQHRWYQSDYDRYRVLCDRCRVPLGPNVSPYCWE